MSTSPKGIKATDQRVNFLTKAKQARYDKKMKMSATKGALIIAAAPNTTKNDFKLWAANGTIINSGKKEEIAAPASSSSQIRAKGGLIDANM